MIIVSPFLASVFSVVIRVGAITFWPFIIARKPLSAIDEQHERIHLAQQLELLLLGFYALYVWDYFAGRLSGLSKDEAYRQIRFEREAYTFEAAPDYLAWRPFWAWRDLPPMKEP